MTLLGIPVRSIDKSKIVDYWTIIKRYYIERGFRKEWQENPYIKWFEQKKKQKIVATSQQRNQVKWI